MGLINIVGKQEMTEDTKLVIKRRTFKYRQRNDQLKMNKATNNDLKTIHKD